MFASNGAPLLDFNREMNRSFEDAGPVGIELARSETLNGCRRGKVLAWLRRVRVLQSCARGGEERFNLESRASQPS